MLNIEKVKKLNIPKTPGSYQYFNKKGEILYVGKAVDLKSRVLSYWRESTNHTPAKRAMMKEIAEIKWIEVDTEIEALLLEANLIKKHQPPFNIDMRDDKRHQYIKVSTEEEFPRVYSTRTLDKAGTYFGPFVSGIAVKEVLKVIRRIWPYRSCARLPKKVCLYHRIGKCLGMCEYPETKSEYDKIVSQIVLFLQGNKNIILKDKEKEIKSLESAQSTFGAVDESLTRDSKYELNAKKIEFLKFEVMNIRKVLEHTEIINLIDKYATDVIELAKVLALPKIPERIEGFDISNIFGRDAVGSMVVFRDGEPDKNEYRKFKIKLSEGQASDTFMLKEILDRRLKRSVPETDTSKKISPKIGEYPPVHRIGGKEEACLSADRGVKMWALPDLIIIDGGKGQLNVAVKLLKKYDLDIPVIAVSKGSGLRGANAPDKIFFPGEKEALKLSLASPALHIVKRVRDEAHRFAIKYHRELRKRRWKK